MARKRVVSAIASMVLTASVGLAAASPVSASSCDVRSGKAEADAAWVMGYSGCQYVAVRHRYDPVWSANNYWTAWSGGATMLVPYYTTNTPVYLRHSTQAS